MRVSDVMAQPVFTCRESDSLATVARIMWDHDVGSLPILGGDDRIEGIATDRDLCMAALFTGQPLWATPVGEHLRKSIHGVQPDDSLERALEVMLRHKVRRVPVLDGDRHPVGIISIADLARAAWTGVWGAPDALAVVAAMAEISDAQSPRTARPDRPAPGARAGMTQVFTFRCKRCNKLLEERWPASGLQPEKRPTCPECHRSDQIEKQLAFFSSRHSNPAS